MLFFMIAVHIGTLEVWRDHHVPLNFAQTAPIRMSGWNDTPFAGNKWLDMMNHGHYLLFVSKLTCCLDENPKGYMHVDITECSNLKTAVSLEQVWKFHPNDLEVIFDSGLNSFALYTDIKLYCGFVCLFTITNTSLGREKYNQRKIFQNENIMSNTIQQFTVSVSHLKD